MAALIAFYKGDLREGYTLRDDPEVLSFFSRVWNSQSAEEVVKKTLSHTEFWGEDLTDLEGFETVVSAALNDILCTGMRGAVVKRVEHHEMLEVK